MIAYFTKHLIIRYLISGGTSASVNIGLFSVLHYYFKIHYILSNIFAFVVAFFVSLVLQKFWTFQDHSTENIHMQGLFYLFSSLFGLGLNTSILYVSVDVIGVKPIVGVIIAGVLTAMCTFQINKKYIFKSREGVKI
ncbi:MAG TPA: GtrA family protein [Parcubacteria group bacterium]|jgi:putative flippase GtrA|nr:GtrA family protein [Parcubacteria group bacterium]